MAKKDEIDLEKTTGVSRRDFLKIAAATGVGGAAGVLDWVTVAPNPALAAVVTNGYDKITTCPYCSVGCNMRVGTDASGNVVDIIGDKECPINNGALCTKGAAAIQLVNNTRRVGVPNSIFTESDPLLGKPGPMKRTGDGPWTAVTWDTALTDIAAAMKLARTAVPTSAPGKVTGSANGVAFLGCSHATNEENWIYRKMIANFGTNNIEHQARI
jgi:formate dehydrogenase major subunit